MHIHVSRSDLEKTISSMLATLPSDAFLTWDDDMLLNSNQWLPHTQTIGKLQHITWRTADSIPQDKARLLRLEDFLFRQKHPGQWTPEIRYEYEDTIGKTLNVLVDKGYGKCLLKNPSCREEILRLLLSIGPDEADLYAFAVMPNHIHVLLRNFIKLENLMQDIKGHTAYAVNSVCGTSGEFWYKKYFDRMIRSERQFESTVYYIVNNPRYLYSGQYSIWVKGLGEFAWHSGFLLS